jgi:hypothetical protein
VRGLFVEHRDGADGDDALRGGVAVQCPLRDG